MEPVRPDEVRVQIEFEDGTPVAATLRITGAGVDSETHGDRVSLEGVQEPVELHLQVGEIPG